MNLMLNMRVAEKYQSNSQKARVLTENWVRKFIFYDMMTLNNRTKKLK